MLSHIWDQCGLNNLSPLAGKTVRGALLVTSVVSTYRQTALLRPQQDINSTTLLDDKTPCLLREQQYNYTCSVDSVYYTTPMELLPFEESSH